MPTTRNAFACVLTVCILLSCNSQKNKDITTGVKSVFRADTIHVLPDNFFDIQELNAQFENSITQKFTIPAKKISVVTGTKGLRVTIDPGALEFENGSPLEGKIAVSIIELTTANDLFKSNAATVSNGRLLASGGSYFIGMESNGQKVRLKKDRSLQVDFPVFAKEEMELFYGERDSSGSMNWIKAGNKLEQQFEEISFNTNSNNATVITRPALKSKYHLFNKLDAKVYFMGRLMTLSDMVAEFKKRGIDKFIDTLFYNWYGGSDIAYSYTERKEAGYRHGRQYRIISQDELCQEKELLEMERAQYQKVLEEQDKNNLTGQLKKYYAPATIGTLGWINCDRFYKNNEFTDTELDIPITLNSSQIEYFIIFKSFNGLINNKIKFTAETKFMLKNLPVGEAVTLVAFAKNKGILYQGKEDFIIRKNRKVIVQFNTITPEALSNMFRKNVRI